MGSRAFIPIVLFIALVSPAMARSSSAGNVRASRLTQGLDAEASAPARVSRDSLEAMVRFLSVVSGSGVSRSRFVLREASLALVADSLAARLGRYTGEPVDRIPFTVIDHGYTGYDSTYTAENIVARITGDGEDAGVVFITAHVDAISVNTTLWAQHWREWAAPGADDNGTGVAALMEAARVLPHHELPFDVMFVLFSGEELDRLGSKDFVGRYEDLYGRRILGVINADMLGYTATGSPGGTVLANYRSGWLADMIAEWAPVIEPSLPLAVVMPGPSNYDHASFWDSSYTAVTFAEPLSEHAGIINPRYHTLGDTLSTINFEQVERLSNVIVGFVEEAGAAPAEIALFSTDLAILLNGAETLSRQFQQGDAISVRVRVRNRGAGNPPQASSGRLVITVENSRGTRTLSSEVVDLPEALDFRESTVSIALGAEFLGGNRVRADVFVYDMDDEPENNSGEVWIGVGDGAENPVLLQAVEPNPITGSFGSASFCINLGREVDIGLELFNLEGERLGSAFAGARWGRPLEQGMNCVELGTLFPLIDRLASGIYLYRLAVYEEGAARRSYTGRFAVVQ